jgi:hypothetical protein
MITIEELGVVPVLVRVIDVAEKARQLYGDEIVAEICGDKPLPDHDYRFEVTWPNGTVTTFAAGTSLSADQLTSRDDHAILGRCGSLRELSK